MSLAEGRLVFIDKAESAAFFLTHPMSLQRHQLSLKLFHTDNIWLLMIFLFLVNRSQAEASWLLLGPVEQASHKLRVSFALFRSGVNIPYLKQGVMSCCLKSAYAKRAARMSSPSHPIKAGLNWDLCLSTAEWTTPQYVAKYSQCILSEFCTEGFSGLRHKIKKWC